MKKVNFIGICIIFTLFLSPQINACAASSCSCVDSSSYKCSTDVGGTLSCPETTCNGNILSFYTCTSCAIECGAANECLNCCEEQTQDCSSYCSGSNLYSGPCSSDGGGHCAGVDQGCDDNCCAQYCSNYWGSGTGNCMGGNCICRTNEPIKKVEWDIHTGFLYTIRTDSNKNVYGMSGNQIYYQELGEYFQNIKIKKYNPSGELIFESQTLPNDLVLGTYTLPWPYGENDYGQVNIWKDYHIDSNGNYYVWGQYRDRRYLSDAQTPIHQPLIIAKIGSDGIIDWVKKENFESNNLGIKVSGTIVNDIPYAVYCSSLNFPTPKCRLIKYNHDTGKMVQITDLSITNDVTYTFYYFNLKVAESGNFYLVNRHYLIKLDSNGNVLWEQKYTADYSYGGTVLTIDSQENIYVASMNELKKYNSERDLIWNKIYTDSFIGEVIVDDYDNVYVLSSYKLDKYSSSGELIWSYEPMGYLDFKLGSYYGLSGDMAWDPENARLVKFDMLEPCVDNDGDAYSIEGGDCGPIDCDDTNPDIYPNAPELCDGIDNQCPGDVGYGIIDEGCTTDIDCGLRINDNTETINVACEPEDTLTSPLRISKNSKAYGIILVDPADSLASKIRIKTAGGIKAFKKFE